MSPSCKCDFIADMRSDIKELSDSLNSLREELIELRAAHIERNTRDIEKIWKEIEDPRKVRLVIITRIFIAIFVATLIGIFSWIADTLYKAPSPDQQKLIYVVGKNSASSSKNLS